jgi:hypothetical protein
MAFVPIAATNAANSFTAPQRGPFLDKGGAVMNAHAYGVVGNGVVDDTAALSALVELWKDTDEATLLLPHGRYRFSSLPNLINSNGGRLVGTGRPVLVHTGTGRALEVSWPSQEVDQHIENVVLECNTNTTEGWYFHNVHHSRFLGLEVRKLTAANSVAFRVGFAVCNRYVDFVSSFMHVGLSGNAPANIMVLGDAADATKSVTACIIENLIAEGATSHGLVLANAQANKIVGGTSEGNGGRGVQITPQSYQNTFDTFFCETNAATRDWYVESYSNVFINCTGTSGGIQIANGASNQIIGGIYSRIVLDAGAVRTHLQGAETTIEIVDGGVKTTWQAMKPSRPDRCEPLVYYPADYQGTWASASVDYHPASFALRPDNHVQLRGVMAYGTAGTTALLLPAGYRPLLRQRYICPTNTLDVALVEVWPDGTVRHVGGETLGVALDGITFSTVA